MEKYGLFTGRKINLHPDGRHLTFHAEALHHLEACGWQLQPSPARMLFHHQMSVHATKRYRAKESTVGDNLKPRAILPPAFRLSQLLPILQLFHINPTHRAGNDVFSRVYVLRPYGPTGHHSFVSRPGPRSSAVLRRMRQRPRPDFDQARL